MKDARIEEARRTAFLLYEGKAVPHRSCGIAIAETFGLRTPPYQAFRKGGITGEGPCGAIQAGAAVLGELLGDPDPAGPTTPRLRAAMERYQRMWRERLFPGEPAPDIVCNRLVAPLGEFAGGRRKGFCTSLAAEVAAMVAEAAIEAGHPLEVKRLTT